MDERQATLFGGAQNNKGSMEYAECEAIGIILARNGFTVKNGGYRGMMEAVSKGAAAEGGRVLGYTCEAFGYTKGNQYLTRNLVQKDLFDRLRCLIEDTEVFVVQTGGIGTISEVFLTIDVIRSRRPDQSVSSHQPIIIIFGDVMCSLLMGILDKYLPHNNFIMYMNTIEEFKRFIENKEIPVKKTETQTEKEEQP